MSTVSTFDAGRPPANDHRLEREAARTRNLTTLLSTREDLAGVHGPADFAVEAVSWGI